MPARVEFVGDVIEVTQILRLAGKPLFPMPLVEQFAREREAISVAFRIEAAAGISIPVPGAAKIGRRFQRRRLDAEIDQTLDLVNARNAGADDNHLVMGFGVSHRFLRLSLPRLLICEIAAANPEAGVTPLRISSVPVLT